MAQDRLASRVLLVGWDAADWKFINPLLDAGRMPNLSRIVDHGVIANLATLQPRLSPILWTSIATGKTADKHGITGFVEPIPGGAGLRVVSSASRTTKAIWNILSQNELASVVINWFASHPAEPIRGACIANRFFEGCPRGPDDPWEIVPGSLHPTSLEQEIAEFRMHPLEFSCSDLARLVPEIERIDIFADRRPQQLAEMLARTVSVHSVATHMIEAGNWDFLAVYYDGLDVAGHTFMPFHPPRLPWISEADFGRYQHVMREVYLFHDEMLGRLLDLAGDDTTVLLVSDHGFHCDHLRPAPTSESAEAQAAAWHRQYGVLAMRGPGILEDERIYGTTLLDITPTILTLLGLPIGRDMDGRPLLQALTNAPPSVSSVPSWDLRPGPDGRNPVELQQSMVESTAAVAQLMALGYLPAATVEAKKAVEIAVAESKFNLAIVHSAHGRNRQALEILAELHSADPDNHRYSIALAKTHANLGEHTEALSIVETLEASGWRSADGDLLAAASLYNQGRTDQALARLAECERRYPNNANLHGLIGNVHLACSNWADAAVAFDRALALDQEDPHALNGAARAALKHGKFEVAAEHALRAVGLLFFFPQAHFHLGMAFKGMGETDRAIRSLKLAATQAPGFYEAHQELENLREERALAARNQR